jgi:hypothetical protein
MVSGSFSGARRSSGECQCLEWKKRGVEWSNEDENELTEAEGWFLLLEGQRLKIGWDFFSTTGEWGIFSKGELGNCSRD